MSPQKPPEGEDAGEIKCYQCNTSQHLTKIYGDCEESGMYHCDNCGDTFIPLEEGILRHLGERRSLPILANGGAESKPANVDTDSPGMSAVGHSSVVGPRLGRLVDVTQYEAPWDGFPF